MYAHMDIYGTLLDMLKVILEEEGYGTKSYAFYVWSAHQVNVYEILVAISMYINTYISISYCKKGTHTIIDLFNLMKL